jgi:plasmid stabilization system protein ParE
MNDRSRFALHPLAAHDITEIWEYIAEESPVAARRVRGELYDAKVEVQTASENG